MTPRLDSVLLNYIVEHNLQPGDQLPSLAELSAQLNINVGKLREQLEVARALGLVDVRPRTGIRFRAYDFLPALRLSLLFALALDKSHFIAFTELRNHLEVAFWHEAVERLTDADKAALHELCQRAWQKLNNQPFIQIPHQEHRKFHMGIFAHLDNPFVRGLLEAYWEAYEAVELNTYADLAYWQEAWRYHEKILQHILENNSEAALQAFIEHTQLLRHRNSAGAPANSVFHKPTNA
ncbi:MAG: FCD domain-containing protein [Aggregatilineales bacterium]